MWILLWILPMLSSLQAEKVYFHTYYGTVLSKEDLLQQTIANRTFWCSIGIEQPCDPNEGRRLDGSCNNLQHPTIGSPHTPYIRLLPPDFGDGFEPKPAQSGAKKASSRKIRTTLLTTGLRSDRIFTHLATHFFLATATDIGSVHDSINYLFWKQYCCLPEGKTDSECIPIKVPDDDPTFRYSDIRCLNQTRPITYQSTGCIRNGTTPQRINSATPVFDLSFMYGKGKERLYYRGLLKYELDNGRMYPPSNPNYPNICVQNQLPRETRCHGASTEGFNNILGVNLMGMWFWRNHNRIASALSDINPCWTDDKTFEIARDINIATYMQIFFYEFLPLLLGRSNLRRYNVVSENRLFRDNYDPDVLPQISLEFQYILRWAHLMQEGRVKMYDETGKYLKQISISDIRFRTGYLAVDNNLDYITQGSFRQATGKVDYTVDPDIGNRLSGGLQRASDLTSSDLNKGGYFGFPPYVDYVEYCSGRKINNFEDLKDFIDEDNLDLLRDVYDNVRDIDLLAGTWMEKPIKGGFAPPTFFCIVVKQLIRSIASDRHWYERPNRPNAFTLEQLLEIRNASISRVLCDVGDKVTQIQKRGFERLGPKNKMVYCSEIEGIDLTAWKDCSCGNCKQT